MLEVILLPWVIKPLPAVSTLLLWVKRQRQHQTEQPHLVIIPLSPWVAVWHWVMDQEQKRLEMLLEKDKLIQLLLMRNRKLMALNQHKVLMVMLLVQFLWVMTESNAKLLMLPQVK